MRLEFGSPVQCLDGPAGELADVVVARDSRCVTHLVVEPRHRHRLARLVPIDLVRPGSNGGAISLTCTTRDVAELQTVEEYAYLRLAEPLTEDPEWEPGVQRVLAEPSWDESRFGIGTPAWNFDPHVSITYDRIPKGEAELRRASSVTSADGHRLGHISALLVDEDERVTHVVLERGHLFGRGEVAVPVAAIARVATDAVTLTLDRDEVASLPSRRRAA